MKTIKVGIIGAGTIASYHCNGFRAAGAEVVAVSDTRLDAAKAFAEGFGIPQYCADLESMLKCCSDLDAVSLAVPNFLHKPLSIQALNAGLHVYCEKPPALNEEEAIEMAEAAEQAGKCLMFDFNNRLRTESQTLHQYIQDGVMGRINSVQSTWIRRNGIPGFGGWFTQKKTSGGGPVIDLLHMLDLGLYMMDYPKPDCILARTYDDFMGNPDFKGPWGIPDRDTTMDVESACHGFITFKDGQCLSLRTSWAEMNEREVVSLSMQGTKAGAKMERLFGVDGIDETSHDTCKIFTVENGLHVNRDIIIPPDASMGRLKSAVNFIEAIAGTAVPNNTPQEAVRLMKIIDAIYTSAREKRPVFL